MYIATMRNMTNAQKGANALNSLGFLAKVVSLDPTLTKNGCAYGVAFAAQSVSDAVKILKAKKVLYGEIIGSGE